MLYLLCAGFSLRGLLLWQGMGSQAHWPHSLWCAGLAALQRVGSPRTRNGPCVPCIGKQALNHWTTEEVL